MSVRKKELTEKEALFCQIYIKNFNATMAVIKAGYDVKNSQSASVIGYELLNKTLVRAEIDRLKEEKKKAIFLTEDDVVERYMRIAFADMTDFVEFGEIETPVEIINPETLEKETVLKRVNTLKLKSDYLVDGGLICQIKVGKDGATLKLEDRLEALQWLSDFFNMNPMNRHKRDFEREKLKLEREKLEYARTNGIAEDDTIEVIVKRKEVS